MTKHVASRPCWDAKDIAYALPIDAGAMPSELFRTVHVPAVITRFRYRGLGSAPDEGERCTEAEVLHDLLAGEATMRVAAVTGEVGTGKSHLVRWLYVELRRRASQDQGLQHLHVVYVPKTRTTFKKVVERILEGQKGKEFEEFKARLERAQEGLVRATAAERLVDEIANCIRDQAVLNDTTDDPYRTRLLKDLPTLVQDPVYRTALLIDNGVVRRTIDRALDRGGASEEPVRFQEEDLQLDLEDHSEMSPRARRLYAKLLAADEWTAATLKLLNEVIDAAVGALFDVRRGEVGALFVDVRAALAEEGRELVLLIEDLALLQGVERELLEAIIAPAEEVDGRVLCPVRAALAVTTGHFEQMATVRSRLDADGGYVYSLNASLHDAESGTRADFDDVEQLVGSYLNAARLGKSEIQAWAQHHFDDESTPPNVCEHCEFGTSCREAFGRDRAGHGLYPLNRSSLQRIMLAERNPLFDPRDVLKHLRELLRDERAAIEKRQFPTEEWAGKHDPAITPIADGVVKKLREHYKTEAKARQAEYLQLFWGGGVYDEAVRLPDGIHEAFGVEPLPGARELTPEEIGAGGLGQAPPTRRRKSRPETRESKTPLEVDENRLAQWRTALRTGNVAEHEVPGTLARELRQDFAEMLLQQTGALIDFVSYPAREAATDLALGIHIEGAASGNPRSADATILRLEVEAEPVFLALRRRRAGAALESPDLNAMLVACTQYAPIARAWLRESRADQTERAQAVQILYLSAVSNSPALYDAEGPASDATVLEALWSTGPDENPPPDLRARIELESAFKETDARSLALRTLQATAAVKQSPTRGEPQGIDAASILRAVDEFRQSDLKVPKSRQRTGLPAALDRIATHVVPVLDESDQSRNDLVATLQKIEPEATSADLTNNLTLMIDASGNAGLDIGDLTALRREVSAIQRLDIEALRVAAKREPREPSTDGRLRYYAAIPWHDAIDLIRAVEAVERALAQSEASLQESRGGQRNPNAERTAAIERAESASRALRALGQALQGAGEHAG